MEKVNNWADELEQLKSIIDKTQLTETIKWGTPTYVLNSKNVLGVAGFKNYFALWFFKGVFLKDEKKHLVNAQEGVTKSLRQWRFYSKEEINEKEILSYINEAIAIENQGIAIKPEKKTFEISEEFQTELDENLALKTAFEKFSKGKQTEFLEYISEAKQLKTKLSRIEKIKPMIIENIGLNDKYRK